MTIRISLLLTAALLIAGCTSDTPVEEPVEEPVIPEISAVSYTCDSDNMAEATYENGTILLAYGGEIYTLTETEVDAGTRYDDGNFVWWIDGNEASVFEVDADGNLGEAIDTCRDAASDWVDEAMDDVEQAVEDGADAVEDAAGDVVDGVEEATEG